jgi:glycosyltransferase involved in cell wall biosynthesis
MSFARADHICAVSRFVADTTRRLLGLGTRPIEVLPNPVDTEKFRPYPEIPEEEGLVCFTGGLREKKGVRQLIQAMPAIVEAVPCAHLWLQGEDTTDPQTGGSYRTTLERSTPEVVRDRVRFCGPVANDSLPQRNAQASVLVYPSWMEAHSLVILEGMASGKAVVSSSTGPGPESIDHGINGLLCDPRDPYAIAEGVIRCLQSTQLRRQLGSNARRTAIERFAVDRIVNENERFYERCLG